jgi:hypothetical protein
VVQFARRPQDGREYAVKFFLDQHAFYSEAALYEAYFPALRKHLKNTPAASQAQAAPSPSPSPSSLQESDVEVHRVEAVDRIAGARFLPHVEVVCDSAEAGLVDPRKEPLPPCIVMERGESLQEWSDRAEPDRFTSFSVWLASVPSASMNVHVHQRSVLMLQHSE